MEQNTVIAVTFFAFSIIVGLVTVLISYSKAEIETMTLSWISKECLLEWPFWNIFMAVGIVISTALKRKKQPLVSCKLLEPILKTMEN